MRAVQTETLHRFALYSVIWWYHSSGSCSFCAWLQFHCAKQITILGQWLNDRFAIKQRRHKMKMTVQEYLHLNRVTTPTVIVYSAYKREVVVVFHLAIHFFNLTFLLTAACRFYSYK